MSWNDSYKLPKTVTKTDIAYLAGLMDGEGCITITKQKPGTSGRVNPSHRLYVKVTIGQREVLEWVLKTFQVGTITIQKHPHYNVAYNWWVASLQATALLRVLYPYLQIKKEQADLAFQFAELYWQRGSSLRLPTRVVQQRERLYKKMQEAKPSHRFRLARLR